MESCNNERKWFIWCLGAAAILGALGFLMSTVTFIRVIFTERAINLPNLMFILFRLMPIITPLALLLRSDEYIAKILRLKVVVGFWAAFSLYGFLWVMYFIDNESLRELFEFEKIYEYQISSSRCFVGNYVQWGTYGVSGVVFSLVLCVMLGLVAGFLHHHRYLVAGGAVATFLFTIIAPLINSLVVNHSFYSKQWLEFNIIGVLSAAALCGAICIAARSDTAWIQLVWGEDMTHYMIDKDER